MPRMQLRPPGDAELISCYRRHQRWGVQVEDLACLQASSSDGQTHVLFEGTHTVTQGCTSLNSKAGIV